MLKEPFLLYRNGSFIYGIELRNIAVFGFPAELGHIEFPIGPFVFQQFFMVSFFCNTAVFEYQNCIGVPDGGKPVGYDKGGST